MKRLLLIGALLLILLFLPKLKVFAACRVINVMGGACDPGYSQCSNLPTVCCQDPNTECTTNEASQYQNYGANLKPVCTFAGDKQGDCNACMADGKGSWTAIGCIPATGSGIFTSFFSIGTGIAGGIAFLLIIFGGFQMMTSAGNPEQLNSGKELVTSAVAGLLLIIFSVFLLKIIGVNILGIPGFS